MNLGKVLKGPFLNKGGGSFQMIRNVGGKSLSFLWSKYFAPEICDLGEVIVIRGIVTGNISTHRVGGEVSRRGFGGTGKAVGEVVWCPLLEFLINYMV
jgi:hypothetical protein